MEPWKTLSLCLRSSTGLTAGWGPVRPVHNVQTSRSVSSGERQTLTWTGVFLCSGETFYLPDRQRDDLCSKHQVDRLQQQRSAVCECVVVFSHSVLVAPPVGQQLYCRQVCDLFPQVITPTSPRWLMCRKMSWSICTCSAVRWSSTTTTTSFGQKPTWTRWWDELTNQSLADPFRSLFDPEFWNLFITFSFWASY